jgi:acetoacetyl-CoA synthetase
MPLGLLDDEDGSRFRATYFDEFLPRVVWNQADMIQRHSYSKGFTVLGRSDGVLNPGGVRFGTTELYNITDPEFESIVVPFKEDHDEKV